MFNFWAEGWLLAWPRPQDGLGQGGPRLKLAKGRFGSKNDEKVKVLRMGLPIVENLSGPQESIFNLSRAPNSILAKNLEEYRDGGIEGEHIIHLTII